MILLVAARCNSISVVSLAGVFVTRWLLWQLWPQQCSIALTSEFACVVLPWWYTLTHIFNECYGMTCRKSFFCDAYLWCNSYVSAFSFLFLTFELVLLIKSGTLPLTICCCDFVVINVVLFYLPCFELLPNVWKCFKLLFFLMLIITFRF